MSRQKPEHAQVTWQDVTIAVGEWEAHLGVSIRVELGWRANLTAGAFLEVVLCEGEAVGRGEELIRVREAFPARKMSGQPGAVLYAISAATRALEGEPWLWTRKMRREVKTGA